VVPEFISANARRDAVCSSVRCRQARHRFLREAGERRVMEGRADASSPTAGDGSYPSCEALHDGYLPLPSHVCRVRAGQLPAPILVLARRLAPSSD
jgi:hypothetical protein